MAKLTKMTIIDEETGGTCTLVETAKEGRALIRSARGAQLQLATDWGYIKVTSKEMLTHLAKMDDPECYDVSVRMHEFPETETHYADCTIFVDIRYLG